MADGLKESHEWKVGETRSPILQTRPPFHIRQGCGTVRQTQLTSEPFMQYLQIFALLLVGALLFKGRRRQLERTMAKILKPQAQVVIDIEALFV